MRILFHISVRMSLRVNSLDRKYIHLRLTEREKTHTPVCCSNFICYMCDKNVQYATINPKTVSKTYWLDAGTTERTNERTKKSILKSNRQRNEANNEDFVRIFCHFIFTFFYIDRHNHSTKVIRFVFFVIS